ncbi:hypothetical protein OHA19_05205 [Streptomyces sp. NBC_00012]
MLGVRPVVTATLAADHRATDAVVGARYLTAVDRTATETGGVMSQMEPLNNTEALAVRRNHRSTRGAEHRDHGAHCPRTADCHPADTSVPEIGNEPAPAGPRAPRPFGDAWCRPDVGPSRVGLSCHAVVSPAWQVGYSTI